MENSHMGRDTGALICSLLRIRLFFSSVYHGLIWINLQSLPHQTETFLISYQ